MRAPLSEFLISPFINPVSHTPMDQGTLCQRGWIDAKSQKTRKSAVRLFLLEITEGTLRKPQQYSFRNKTFTVTTSIDLLTQSAELSRGTPETKHYKQLGAVDGGGIGLYKDEPLLWCFVLFWSSERPKKIIHGGLSLSMKVQPLLGLLLANFS